MRKCHLQRNTKHMAQQQCEQYGKEGQRCTEPAYIIDVTNGGYIGYFDAEGKEHEICESEPNTEIYCRKHAEGKGLDWHVEQADEAIAGE